MWIFRLERSISTCQCTARILELFGAIQTDYCPRRKASSQFLCFCTFWKLYTVFTKSLSHGSSWAWKVLDQWCTHHAPTLPFSACVAPTFVRTFISQSLRTYLFLVLQCCRSVRLMPWALDGKNGFPTFLTGFHSFPFLKIYLPGLGCSVYSISGCIMLFEFTPTRA